jgi:hypothetical protein
MRNIGMVIVAAATLGFGINARDAGESADREPVGRADGPNVRFADCTEFAGLTAVPIGNVRSRVPSHYEIAGGSDGIGVVVFRTASCLRVTVDDLHPHAAIVAQVGINVVAPLGTGDINNYTLYFATDSPLLFVRLRRAGVHALFVPALVYQYSPNPAGDGGDLFIDVPRPRRAQYELGGFAFEPLAGDPGFPFVANWWRETHGGDLVMETTIPNIRFGDGAGVLITVDPGSDLESILGATSANFPLLAVRGVFAEATMEVRRVRF